MVTLSSCLPFIVKGFMYISFPALVSGLFLSVAMLVTPALATSTTSDKQQSQQQDQPKQLNQTQKNAIQQASKAFTGQSCKSAFNYEEFEIPDIFAKTAVTMLYNKVKDLIKKENGKLRKQKRHDNPLGFEMWIINGNKENKAQAYASFQKRKITTHQEKNDQHSKNGQNNKNSKQQEKYVFMGCEF